MSDDIVDRFVQVFRGRADAYGSAKGFCVNQPLTRAVFERHLTSADPNHHIGVYCMLGDQCSWGCIDIDGKDWPAECSTCPDYAAEIGEYCGMCAEGVVWDWDRMSVLAHNLRAVLLHKGVPSHIEQTKNGYHVWCFPDPPLVPAATMRRALMAACKAVRYDPKEVNPKSEGPRPGTKGLGNFVRLPYGGALSAEWEPLERFIVDSLGGTQVGIYLPSFLDRVETGGRASTDKLEAIAGLWTPPTTSAQHAIDYDAGLDDEATQRLVKMLAPLAFTIWRDGPLDGKDRSTTLAKLAHLVCEQGFTPKQAFAILKSADVRMGGKFANRADGDDQLARLVDNAYSREE